MNKNTGLSLTDLEHLQQSISDILTTPIGSRVMRRSYGSDLFELIDKPLNDATALEAKAVAVMALMRWEPRISLTRIGLALGDQLGQAFVDVEGYSTVNNGAVSLRVPLAFGGV
ncbi:GPW/gp25 family protein (plasmid) [Pseudomonas luteola]